MAKTSHVKLSQGTKTELSPSIVGEHSSEATERVLKTLRLQGALSSTDIARISGLAKSTVSGIVAKLRESGVVIDAPKFQSDGRGRPATLLMLNPKVGGVIGIFIDLDQVRAVLADVSHAVLASRSLYVGPDYSPDEGLDAAERLIAEVTAAVGFTPEQIFGVGIAIPGPVHPATGRVGRSNIVPRWRGVHVGRVIGRRLPMPVFVDNESNCSALSELMWGAAQNVGSAVYIKLDVGVGGAVIINNKIVRGVAGGAGELGHMTYRPDGPLCGCGNRGCFHMYCSTPVLLEQLRPQYGVDFTVAQMVALARSGDIGCARVIADAADIAGQAVALACNVLNPERVIVGGPLAATGDVLFEPLRRAFNRHALLLHEGEDPDATTAIVPGTKFGDDLALGAVALVLHRLGEMGHREAEIG